MRRAMCVCLLMAVAFLVACHTPTQEARRMVRQAEWLADTLPDSTVHLIDSVLHMPAYLSERERMDIALLQAEALFGCRDGMHAVSTLSPVMDDDFFEDKPFLSTSPELERAAAYYAGKKQHAKAAHAALYSGFVQQHYNEKEAAMRSFKEAEHYGGLVSDSLTVAQAQYWMGKILIDEDMDQEALALLQAAHLGFGDRFIDKALTMNAMGVCYILQGDVDNAETCLNQSLLYEEKSHSNSKMVNYKVLNNYAVLYRIQGKYDQAVASLQQMMEETCLDDVEWLMINLNLGNVYFDMGEKDSAAVYYHNVEKNMSVDIMKETKVAALGAFSRFAEDQGKDSLAIQYRKNHEQLLYEVMQQRQKQAIYRIQQQYDYESLQNMMNRKLIQKQHVITLLGILTIIGLVVLAASQIRLAKTRKQEAETKANLFHFMQQNKELAQRSEEQKRNQIYLTQKRKESERAYEDLLREKEKREQTVTEYGEKLSLELKKQQSIMLRLHLYLQNRGDEELLKKLEKTVFGKQAHLDAMMATVDRLYPQLREIVKQKDLGLDENEQMDVIMSYFNISRQDEALLLDKTTDMVDKIRNRSRKKIQSASEGNNLPKTI